MVSAAVSASSMPFSDVASSSCAQTGSPGTVRAHLAASSFASFMMFSSGCPQRDNPATKGWFPASGDGRPLSNDPRRKAGQDDGPVSGRRGGTGRPALVSFRTASPPMPALGKARHQPGSFGKTSAHRGFRRAAPGGCSEPDRFRARRDKCRACPRGDARGRAASPRRFRRTTPSRRIAAAATRRHNGSSTRSRGGR